jgi:hypothetical protein
MSDLALSSAAATGRMPGIAESLGRLFRGWSDPYRPELHYMRGPGPKWREKHARQAANCPSPDAFGDEPR